MTVNMAPQDGSCGSQQGHDDNSGFLDNGSRTAIGKDSQFGKHPGQYHPPQGYGYQFSQQAFPGAPRLYHLSPFTMTQSSQPTTSAS